MRKVGQAFADARAEAGLTQVEVARLSPGDPVTVQLLSGSTWLDHAPAPQAVGGRSSCC